MSIAQWDLQIYIGAPNVHCSGHVAYETHLVGVYNMIFLSFITFL